MSDSSKGASYENRVRGFLESRGYLTEKAYRSVIWIRRPGNPRPIPISKRVDLFGCLDIVGFHPSYPPVLAQVTTSSNRSVRRGKVVKGLSKILTSTLHMDGIDILVLSWGKWEKRGYGFVVDRLDGLGVHGVPTWEDFWSPWAEDGFIPSKDAPVYTSKKDVGEVP